MPTAVGQYVVITGLGLDEFKNAITAVENIHSLFRAEADIGELAPFSRQVVHGYDALKISNRFLTPKHQVEDSEHDPESMKVIDPHSHLRNLASDRYVHSEENVVEYWRLKSKRGSEKK